MAPKVPILEIAYSWLISQEELESCINTVTTLTSLTFIDNTWQLLLCKDRKNPGYLQVVVESCRQTS